MTTPCPNCSPTGGCGNCAGLGCYGDGTAAAPWQVCAVCEGAGVCVCGSERSWDSERKGAANALAAHPEDAAEDRREALTLEREFLDGDSASENP